MADLAFCVFEKSFLLGNHPTGTIRVATDDFAEVLVNGVSVGVTGSVQDSGAAGRAQSFPVTFDLSAALRSGSNLITIVGQNGPASFAGCGASGCTYAANPAGVVFSGTLRWQE
jgi:hypothetical protein